MAKYQKRKDGRYYTSIPSGEFTENGKEIRIPVYGRTIAEFEANKDAIKAQLLTGTYSNDKGTTFSEYKWQWYETYIKNTELSHARKSLYHNTLKNHTSLLDSLPLGTIKKSHVQNGYNMLNGHADLQHEYKIAVNQIFKAAVEDGLISRNPADSLTIARNKRKKKRALTKIERDAIAKADFTLKEQCFVLILMYAGLRREEILALTRSDVDLSSDTISVNNIVEFIGEKPNFRDSAKTPQGERIIDILSPLKPVLTEYINQLDGLILFPNNAGTLMSKTQYRRFFEKIKIKINSAAGGKHHYEKLIKGKYTRYELVFDVDMCQGLSAHVFRHEYATILYYSGIDLLEAIRLFGHADSKTLTDIYAELRKDESRSKEKLNEYVEKQYNKKILKAL